MNVGVKTLAAALLLGASAIAANDGQTRVNQQWNAN